VALKGALPVPSAPMATFDSRLSGLYLQLGRSIAGTLRCGVCDGEQPCPGELAAHYLREGWPTCCGETMSLVAEAPILSAEEAPPHPTPAPQASRRA
jgi:hypothetical protein